MTKKNPYGYCPVCGAESWIRERRPNGDDICKNKHKYPSKDAMGEGEFNSSALKAAIENGKRLPTVEWSEM